MDSEPLAPEFASRPGPLVGCTCPAWRRPRPGSPGVVGMAQGALPHGTLGLPGSASWGSRGDGARAATRRWVGPDRRPARAAAYARESGVTEPQWPRHQDAPTQHLASLPWYARSTPRREEGPLAAIKV